MTDITEHFQDKPEKIKKIFDALQEKIKTFGHVEIEPTNAGVIFRSGSQFAMVNIFNDFLTLEFAFGERLHDERIKRVDELTEDEMMHYVILSSKKDIDDQLISWLQTAYERKQ